MVLATSYMLDGKDARSDKEQFDTTAQFLFQLKENGNFAAKEFCQHIDAAKAMMASARLRKGGLPVDATAPGLTQTPSYSAVDVGHALGDEATAGMALCEPSLQELMTQPVLDLQFIDASLYQDGVQGLYWPDISPESWTPDTWVAPP